MKIIKFVIILLLFILFTIISHETGHVLAAKMFGFNLTFYIWPGYEIYPNLGSIYQYDWPDKAIAFSVYAPPLTPSLDFDMSTVWSDFPIKEKIEPVSSFDDSIVDLMGSGFNLLLSFLSLFSIYRFKPKGIWLFIYSMGALLHYDLLLYSVLPLFDLRHFFFWGGKEAEPILALSKMGLSYSLSISLVIALSAIQFVYLYKLLIDRSKTDNNLFYDNSQ